MVYMKPKKVDTAPVSPETGEFRYNTDTGLAEIYDGAEWLAATGPVGDTVSEELMDLIIDEWINPGIIRVHEA